MFDRLRRLRRRIAQRMTRDITTQQPGSTMVCDDWSNVLMGCCDCGLMHRYAFRIDEDGRLLITGRRDHVATAATREARVFPCAPH